MFSNVFLSMRLVLFFILIRLSCFSQGLIFDPGSINENVISGEYYNTEYIFITNNSDETIMLRFDLVEESVPSTWHASGCTNQICYIHIPDQGMFGILNPGEQAYMSINLSNNGTIGDAKIRFAVYNPDNNMYSDTISFIYSSSESDELSETQPWAKLNFAENVLTVFLKDGFSQTSLRIFDLSGNLVLQTNPENIFSFSFNHLANGIYIANLETNSGERLVEKIVVVR